MKISRLLVLSALWLGLTGTVQATIVDGVRQKPAPAQTQGFEASETTDTYFYLYNVDAKAFFTEGNAWGTQVSIGDKGLKVAFTVDGNYDLTYLFNDFSLAKNAWKLTFFDNENSMFVDLGNQANYRWGVEDNGATFRLFAQSEENGNPGWDATTDAETGETIEHPAYREGMYMGWKTGSTSTACVPYLPVEEGNCINWAFVTEENYAPYAEAIDVWVVAEKLRVLIEDVKAKGFTETSAYEAIYANEAATKAELEKAISDLNAAFVEWGKTNASLENPADLTNKIVNPSFDGNDLTTGWSTKFNANGGKENAEYWNMNYNTYQDIKELPEGVYALGVNAFYRAGSNGSSAIQNWLAHNEASKYAKLYAVAGGNTRQTAIANVFSGAQAENQNVGDVAVTYDDPESGESVTVYVPNNMGAAEYYMHTLGQYKNTLYLAVNAGDTLRIGVKKDVNIGDEWSIFDDFSLTYYGKAADACQFYLQKAMEDYSDYVIEPGTLYTKSYLEAYQAAYSNNSASASSLAEVNAILKSVDETKAALDKNIKLWKEYTSVINEARNMVVNPDYEEMEPAQDLADYIEDDEEGYEFFIDELSLTNEEIEAEIAKVKAWMNEIIELDKLGVYEGKNMTKFITNPTFEKSTTENSGTSEGWTVDRVDGGNVTPGPINGDGDTFLSTVGYYNACFESWHCHKWDVWQEIKNLPVGMYELQVQGYVRCEVGGYQRGDELVEPYTSPVYLYMNNAMSQFPSVYSEIPAEAGVNFQIVESWTKEEVNGNEFPNSMGGAAQCFHIDEEAGLYGMYKTTAYGLIAKEGDTFRIGVKMDKNEDWWCIWDNFKLIYHEPTAELVQPVLEEALKSLNLDQAMGKDIYEQASALNQEAQDAIAAKDGKAMFAVLTKVYDLSAAIIKSVALFQKLSSAAESLNEAISSSENQDAKDEANNLYTTIMNGIEEHSITDAEATEYLEKIAVVYTKLMLPSDWASASDDDPKDVTAVIKSASFSDVDETANSSEGWTNPGNLGNDDTQKSALAIEFWQSAFDMYQTIKGLPEGTYELTVDAWVRNGENDENFTGWKEDPSNSMALLYGVDGDSVVYTAPIANMMAAGDAMLESTGYEGEGEFSVDGVTYYVPGSLVSGKGLIEMNPGTYTNKAIVKVKADETLTIGIKKAQEKTSSWVVADDFKLYYLGKNSSKAGSPDLTGIATVEGKTAKVEYFTLDGRKATKAHKGIMIQKVTLSNGATLIQKIRN
ncbi:hypothetical protein M1D30_12425 [Prevotella sp. E15-22]|uniref:hypothetical protein n=1 Tax=Prevotella sp. E15-22 TaxID=2937774 RepID=UPI002057452E|nr:hypothetical protein [Prevotella sp. E15-22]UPS44352.1 hypothetical protein M1D30_12425 [Prevotella sp. E15-22]